MSSAELALARDPLEPMGHAERIRALWRAASAGRLPHALSFQGPRGIGKFQSARWLAQGLLCKSLAPNFDRPCGECGSCKRFLSNNHIDCLVIDAVEREREQLLIGWFVERAERTTQKSRADGDDSELATRASEEHLTAEAFLSLRPAEGGWRVILVREAERMNVEAQNAILKMLEEPGDRVLWVLETSEPERLTETVRSRCVTVRFEALDAAQCAAVLKDRIGDATLALRLARWGHGAPGVAISLGDRNALELGERIIRVLAGECDSWIAAREIWEVEGEFAGRTPTATARDRARTVLDLALDMLADLARAKAGRPIGELAHGELAERLAPDVLSAQNAGLERKLGALLEARADIDKNLESQALLERALFVLEPARAVRR